MVHTYDHTCGNSASKSAGLGSLVSRWIMSVIPPVNRTSSLEASVYIHYSLTAKTSIIIHHDYINVYYIDIWDTCTQYSSCIWSCTHINTRTTRYLIYVQIFNKNIQKYKYKLTYSTYIIETYIHI